VAMPCMGLCACFLPMQGQFGFLMSPHLWQHVALPFAVCLTDRRLTAAKTGLLLDLKDRVRANNEHNVWPSRRADAVPDATLHERHY